MFSPSEESRILKALESIAHSLRNLEPQDKQPGTDVVGVVPAYEYVNAWGTTKVEQAQEGVWELETRIKYGGPEVVGTWRLSSATPNRFTDHIEAANKMAEAMRRNPKREFRLVQR